MAIAEAPGTPSGNRFRQTWTPERVLAAVRSWAEEFGAPPTSTEWEVGKPEKYADRALAKARMWQGKAARFEGGNYPSNDTVRRLFGSFSKALSAAGFEPRPPGRTPRAVTDRQAAMLRQRSGGMAAGPAQLAADFKAVARANAAKDPLALRGALMELAATALAWCDRVPAAEEAA
jgi:hypothetical protein